MTLGVEAQPSGSDPGRPLFARELAADVARVLVSRAARLLAFGATSVVLALHLEKRGFGMAAFGLLVTLTLLGDAALTLGLATFGGRLGKKRVLLGSAVFLSIGLVVFALSSDPAVLWVTATIGILSPSGGEAGPATAIEQAALAGVTEVRARPQIYAWYNLTGSVAVAFGSKLGGSLAELRDTKSVFLGAAVVVLAGALPLLGLSGRVESSVPPPVMPLAKSKRTVGVLSALFALDSFGSGLVLQSALALWLRLRFGFSASTLGSLFFTTNLLSAASALLAARLATRIGLLRTMVFTHIPANLFLLGLAFAPNGKVAITLVCLRFCLAQMDVPARMAFVMRAVPEEERTQAAVVTSLARSTGNALGPLVTGALLATRSFRAPVVLASLVKIAYDIGLYRAFKAHEAEAAARVDRPEGVPSMVPPEAK